MKLIEDDGLGLWVTTSLLASSRHTHVDPVAYSQYERTILHLCNERAQSLPHFLVNSSSILMFHIQQKGNECKCKIRYNDNVYRKVNGTLMTVHADDGEAYLRII